MAFTKSRTLLTLTSFLFLTSIGAFEPFCEYEYDNYNHTFEIEHPNSLQCRICGLELGSYLNFRCYAWNASFDGTAIGSHLTTYQRGAWSGLTVAAPSTSNPIIPTSHMRYAHTNDSGIASFALLGGNDFLDWMGIGTLLSFDYACTDTSYAHAPVDCTVNITSNCYNMNEYGYIDIVAETATYEYDSGGDSPAKMMSAEWSPPPPWGGESYNSYCEDYTYQAFIGDGTPARLYLDNVLYIAYWSIP